MEVGVDAYVSVEDAETYLEARGITAFSAAQESAQQAAIIEATSFLDAAFAWVGRIEDTDQTLGWPRVCAYDREGRLLEDIPTAVANACAELANLALGGRLMPMTLATGTPAVVSERIGDVAVEYDTSATTQTYDYVRLMLRGIGSQRATNVGMSKLVRA